MKAVITTACWGSEYIDALARYSGASFMSPGNIPAAAQQHQITWQLIAPRTDLQAFLTTETCKQISKHCYIDTVAFEDHGIEVGKMPVGFDNNKYSFLSNLQNLAMRRAEGHDVLLFNYADCLWQDGSLPNAIDMIGDDGTDVVLTLGIPVDETKGKIALEPFRDGTRPQAPLVLPPRQTSKLIFDNLHSETQLRYWESPHFSNTPTYLMWDVPDEGTIVRCVHQTIVAMRVKPEDPVYQAGITEGSLDGNFSATAIREWRYQVAADTDKLALFSLYDSAGSSEKLPTITRETVLKLLMITIPIEQRTLLLEPLLFKSKFEDQDLWQQRLDESEEALRDVLENKNSKMVGSQALGRLVGYLMHLKNGPRGSPSNETEGSGRLRKLAAIVLSSTLWIRQSIPTVFHFVAGQIPRLPIFGNVLGRLISKNPPLRVGALKPGLVWTYNSIVWTYNSSRKLDRHVRGTLRQSVVPVTNAVTRIAYVPMSQPTKRPPLLDKLPKQWHRIVSLLGGIFNMRASREPKTSDQSDQSKSV